jgi:hypothetical protein
MSGCPCLLRFQQIAANQKMKYKPLKKPTDFWDYIKTLPDGSISRVWYSGHASQSGLMLSLSHNSSCDAVAKTSDMILTTDIRAHLSLAPKFSESHKQVSKFLGCYTHNFADQGNKIFKVKAEGAINKVDFGVADRASPFKNIIERIEKTPTSVGNTGWTQFHSVP